MTLSVKGNINNGTVAGDGTGENAFEAFEKVNSHFDNLSGITSDSNSDTLYIDVAGKVGIGTVVQEGKLHVGTAGVAAGKAGLQIDGFIQTSQSDIALTSNAVIGSQDSVQFCAETNGYWSWSTGATGHTGGNAGASEVMRLDASGNLGIGNTPSGSYALEVTGDFNCTNVVQPPSTLTALVGGGQSGATALSEQHNLVSVVASAGDSVLLPTAVAGWTRTVINTGANALDLFPNTDDKIDGGAADAAISVASNTTVTVYAYDTTNWVQI